MRRNGNYGVIDESFVSGWGRFEVSSATQVDDNFVGRIARAVIMDEYREPTSLIVKVAPSSKDRRAYLRTGWYFFNKTFMYKTALPALNTFLRGHGVSESETYPGTAR